jgi:hypothetical protein
LSNVDDEMMVYKSLPEQLTLLHTVLLSSDSDLLEEEGEIGQLDDDRDELKFVKRSTLSLTSLSGGDSMAYLEYKRNSSSNLPKKFAKHM